MPEMARDKNREKHHHNGISKVSEQDLNAKEIRPTADKQDFMKLGNSYEETAYRMKHDL